MSWAVPAPPPTSSVPLNGLMIFGISASFDTKPRDTAAMTGVVQCGQYSSQLALFHVETQLSDLDNTRLPVCLLIQQLSGSLSTYKRRPETTFLDCFLTAPDPTLVYWTSASESIARIMALYTNLIVRMNVACDEWLRLRLGSWGLIKGVLEMRRVLAK